MVCGSIAVGLGNAGLFAGGLFLNDYLNRIAPIGSSRYKAHRWGKFLDSLAVPKTPEALLDLDRIPSWVRATVSADGNLLALVSDTDIAVVEVQTHRIRYHQSFHSRDWTPQFSPDSRTLYVSAANARMGVYSLDVSKFNLAPPEVVWDDVGEQEYFFANTSGRFGHTLTGDFYFRVGQTPPLYLRDSGHISLRQLAFAADGASLAFASYSPQGFSWNEGALRFLNIDAMRFEGIWAIPDFSEINNIRIDHTSGTPEVFFTVVESSNVPSVEGLYSWKPLEQREPQRLLAGRFSALDISTNGLLAVAQGTSRKGLSSVDVYRRENSDWKPYFQSRQHYPHREVFQLQFTGLGKRSLMMNLREADLSSIVILPL